MWQDKEGNPLASPLGWVLEDGNLTHNVCLAGKGFMCIGAHCPWSPGAPSPLSWTLPVSYPIPPTPGTYLLLLVEVVRQSFLSLWHKGPHAFLPSWTAKKESAGPFGCPHASGQMQGDVQGAKGPSVFLPSHETRKESRGPFGLPPWMLPFFCKEVALLALLVGGWQRSGGVGGGTLGCPLKASTLGDCLNHLYGCTGRDYIL